MHSKFISKALLCAGWLILSGNPMASGNETEELRSLFYSAWQDQNKLAAFRESVAQADTTKPFVKGYLAMIDFMTARHKKIPPVRLRYFIDGKRRLESAITGAPTDAELRFLRFAVQTSSPQFLGYWGDIKVDKKFLIDKLESLRATDTDLFQRIIRFMIKSGHCSAAERKALQELLGKEF